GGAPARGDRRAGGVGRTRGRGGSPGPRVRVVLCGEIAPAPRSPAGALRGYRAGVAGSAERIRARADGPGEAALRDGVPDHAAPQIVAGSLRDDDAVQPACVLAGATGEIAQAEAQSGRIELWRDVPGDHRREFADARVLPTVVSEILPVRVARTHGARRLDRQSLVHEMLTERRLMSGIPVRVVAARFGDQLAHAAPARGRRIAHHVRDLMGEPERNQFRIEAE